MRTILSWALAAAFTLSPRSEPDSFVAANGLQLTAFAREPMVRNAVAVTVDEQDRVFVTSVVRRKAADLDIRRFPDWVETDLSLTSVEAKRQFFRRELTPENSPRYAGLFEDANRDGVHDWRDLDQLQDMITRLEDTDGDGVADRFLKFPAVENSTVTGIAAGLAAWDGALYATVEPDLVRLRDSTGDGYPDQRDVLASGFSLHIGYGGHNFSGAIIGPDGRLYAAVADRGLNVNDGEFYAPHCGAIVRCELDGSGFEIFATGLRNAQEPAFDAYGNLFAVDNDGDFPGETERLVYITHGSDTGWRTNWQYRGSDWLPWMDEGLSIPAHRDQPAFITPPLRNYVDGPAGFAFNPGTALNPFYHDHFFLTAFPSRVLHAFQLEPDGAGYRMINDHIVAQSTLMVGVGFSPSGALYLTDWSSSGYDMNERGAVWKLDDPAYAGSALRRSTAKLIAMDWSKPALPDLAEHLAHADQRVRMKAQFELVRRHAVDPLSAVATDSAAELLARLHAIWGLGQLIRTDTSLADDLFAGLLAEPDAEVRAQTARILGEAPALSKTVHRLLRRLLQDPADRPRFFAAITLGQHPDHAAFDPLIEYVTRDAQDVFHRHAAIMGLAGSGQAAQLAALSDHAHRDVRLAAIVALRRQGDPAVSAFLPDLDPLVVAEAASAIHDDDSIRDALPALARTLEFPDRLHERTARRALSAALRLREPQFASLVGHYALDAKLPRNLRLHALRLLNDWLDPADFDTVEGRHRPLDSRDPADFTATLGEALLALSQSPDPDIAGAAWAATTLYGVPPDVARLTAMVQQDTIVAASALAQLAQLDHPVALAAAQDALTSRHATVREHALRVIARLDAPDFLSRAGDILHGEHDADAQVVLALLADHDSDLAADHILETMHRLIAGDLASELALDVIEAAARTTDSRIQSALIRYQQAKDASNPLAPYLETLVGGHPGRGQSVFETSLTAQCTLCHRVGQEGSRVGPALTHIGEKDPFYLLEALVNPGAVVTPGFGLTTLTLNSGEAMAGTLMKETPQATVIRLADGDTRRIPVSAIASRTPELSAMPPAGALLSRFELRDLLAYLQTLQPEANEPDSSPGE